MPAPTPPDAPVTIAIFPCSLVMRFHPSLIRLVKDAMDKGKAGIAILRDLCAILQMLISRVSPDGYIG
jgi:hypothetical protein